MKMAVLLAFELNQRESDVITLSRSAYDGIRVAVRQEKTGTLVKVLATQELKAEARRDYPRACDYRDQRGYQSSLQGGPLPA